MKPNNNKIIIGNKEITFDSNIQTVLEFSECFVVLLMDEYNIPNNNVEAWDYNGNKLWNISEIIKFKHPESYTYIWRGKGEQFITGTYSGVRFVIDLTSRTIVDRNVVK